MDTLFSPLTLRSVTLRNRIAMSPMCQYSSVDGFATDWHLCHLGSRSAGGCGLIIVEATGVEPDGRITPNCLGIWKDAHVDKLRAVTAFIASHGAAPAIQLAHAGVKASRHRPMNPSPNAYVAPEQGGWIPVGPSALRFNDDGPEPHELTIAEIHRIRDSFAAAAGRAVAAGFKVIEIHSAHGYLSHSFLSPLMNRRTDAYGGPFDHRTSFLRETVRAVRNAMPGDLPLFVRLSTTDWVDGGWTAEDSVALAAAPARRRRSRRLLQRRCRAQGLDPRRPRVPGSPRRADPARCGRQNRRGGDDHRSRAGR